MFSDSKRIETSVATNIHDEINLSLNLINLQTIDYPHYQAIPLYD